MEDARRGWNQKEDEGLFVFVEKQSCSEDKGVVELVAEQHKQRRGLVVEWGS